MQICQLIMQNIIQMSEHHSLLASPRESGVVNDCKHARGFSKIKAVPKNNESDRVIRLLEKIK